MGQENWKWKRHLRYFLDWCRGFHNLRKIVVSEFVTLDGVMEDPRWSFQFQPSEDYLKVKLNELFTSDGLLLGRVTYEGFAAAWPSMQKDPEGYADWMNNLPKYVVSTTLKEAKWNNSTIIKQNVKEEISRLKQEEGQGNILIFGSRDLVDSLVRYNLVDEFSLWVISFRPWERKTSFQRRDQHESETRGSETICFRALLFFDMM